MSSWSSVTALNSSSDFSFEREPSRTGACVLRTFSVLPDPEAPRRAEPDAADVERCGDAGRFTAGEPPIVMPNTLKPEDFLGSG